MSLVCCVSAVFANVPTGVIPRHLLVASDFSPKLLLRSFAQSNFCPQIVHPSSLQPLSFCYLSQTVVICRRQLSSAADSCHLSLIVVIWRRQLLSVADSCNLLLIVVICRRQLSSVADSCHLSQTVVICRRQLLSIADSCNLSQTVVICRRQLLSVADSCSHKFGVDVVAPSIRLSPDHAGVRHSLNTVPLSRFEIIILITLK